MAEPDIRKPVSRPVHRSRTREEILAAARPLPPREEMAIEDLTEEGERIFFDTILSDDAKAFYEAHPD